ncbi:MAG: serine hydrolase [Candidatus Dormibacteria bacterium]
MTGPPEQLSGGRVAWILTALDGEVRQQRDADAVFYAASTMKVAVLITLFRLVDQRTLNLHQPITVETTYHSAVPGCSFRLDPDDVDAELAQRSGKSVPLAELAERMITVSSNEASNLLLGLVGFARVGAVLSDLGATHSAVHRLIGDLAAKQAGTTNEVTPADLSRLLTAIGSGRAASPGSCSAMTAILAGQQYRDEIPAGLPPGTLVANKNGWVEGVLHDAALVWPPDAAPFCLVVCTEGFSDQARAREAIQELARWAWAEREIAPARPS